MQSPFILGAVVGFTQLVKSLFDKDYRSAVIITGAAAIGAVSGMFSIDGITITGGLVLGLAASGLITVSQALGGRSISERLD